MANAADPHIDAETLEKYSRGDISAKASVPVEEHLLICEICRQRLEETDAFVAAMRAAAAKSRKAEHGAGKKPVRRAGGQP